MTKKEIVKMAGLFSVMLICMSVAWANNATTVGTSVSDSVAAELRGGVTHNDRFTTDTDNYCEGGSCSKNVNAYDSENGTAHHTSANCGIGFGCNTYNKESGCNSE